MDITSFTIEACDAVIEISLTMGKSTQLFASFDVQ